MASLSSEQKSVLRKYIDEAREQAGSTNLDTETFKGLVQEKLRFSGRADVQQLGGVIADLPPCNTSHTWNEMITSK